MSRFFGERHREIQTHFETVGLADRIESLAKTEIVDDDKLFVESRDMFFLSTIDHKGRPTVSYKGGDVGLVKVVEPTTIAFPSYDGNGMYLSMGNISGNGNVGILFIDFETPARLRLHGVASIDFDDPLKPAWKEAELVVRVKVDEIFVNCPRYVHRYQRVAQSRYTPKAETETPFAEWKRIDIVQDVLPPRDHGRTEKSGGEITIEEWAENAQKGNG
jgi:uncharacterized protein